MEMESSMDNFGFQESDWEQKNVDLKEALEDY